MCIRDRSDKVLRKKVREAQRFARERGIAGDDRGVEGEA